MEVRSNVIILNPAGRVHWNRANNAISQEPMSIHEEKRLVNKARRVLNDMEKLWEINHGAVEIREQFHLLRHYLSRLPEVSLKSTSGGQTDAPCNL